ncbi:MAG: DUF5615 family PIN-like protein [Saprospiraceae bacterium]
MARLYGDENFDVHTMELLRQLGHDTLTTRDAGQANQRIPDHEVLAFATANDRAVVTFDRRDYFRLHQANPAHSGIVACTYDADSTALATRIHESIEAEERVLEGKFVRIYRPNK